MKTVSFIFICFIFAGLLHAQEVVRVVNGYIAIQNENIGAKGDRLIIRRNIRNKYYDIGIAEVVKSKNGRTAAKIVEEIAPYHIRPGDFAFKLKAFQSPAEPAPASQLDRPLQIRLGAGYGKRIGDLSQNIPPEFSSYHNGLKSGFSLFSDLAYFHKPSLGYGLMLSQWWTDRKKSDQIFVHNDTGLPRDLGDIQNSIRILYLGPSLFIRQPLSHPKMSLVASATGGYLHFTDDQTVTYTLNDPPVTEKETIEGSTFGMGGTLGLQYRVSPSVGIHAVIDFLFGTLSRPDTESNLYQDRISLNRLDLMLGAVFSF
ncbi:hypothetical protein JW948_08770 [bacterium]|nr:hypothetical protein [bacterium]